jgi:hypothetical protein
MNPRKDVSKVATCVIDTMQSNVAKALQKIVLYTFVLSHAVLQSIVS